MNDLQVKRRVIPISAKAPSARPSPEPAGETRPPKAGAEGVFVFSRGLANLPPLFRFLRAAKTAVLIAHPRIRLTGELAAELAADETTGRYVKYEIRVNTALKSEVTVECFRSLGPLSRLAVLAYWLVSMVIGSVDYPVSASFVPRAVRFARRKARALLSATVQRFFRGTTATNIRLSKYVLSEWLHELDEFRFPAGLHLALTKNCNLRCIMCPYHAEDLRAQHTTGYFDHAERMPPALLEKIIEETGRYGRHLGFGEYDEPFVYKGFARWAAKAKRAGCTVSITTNGTVLPERDALTLLEAGVEHISFSLDAATHESYAKIRLDDFSVPLENLKRLVRLRNEGNYRTQIRACMVLQEHNRHEKDAFFERMKSIGVDMVSFYNLSVLDQGIWKMSVLNFDVDADAPDGRSVCSQLYNQMAVYPDGRVALCCLTTMYVGYRSDVPYVGNVKDSSLREIWLSPEYNRIRAEAFDREFSNSVCRDCTIWHNYQGREGVDAQGLREYKNAYETVVYLR